VKSLIKFSFSRFSESYDREALLQKESAQLLVEFAGIMEGRGIDIGCGTGFVYRFSRWKDMIGIDISEDMIRFYRKFNKKGVIADMEALPFREDSFDYATSNFSLHWADFPKTIREVKRVLKTDGRFVFNIPVGGSMEFVEQLLGNTKFDFLCVPEILQTLKEEDFHIKDFFIENFEREFPDGYNLLVHLHKTGVAVNTREKSLGEKRKIVKKFKEYKQPLILNFKLLFVSCYL